ncbi:hypothetical protein [Undibacterium sp. TC9W]|uniref:hypothetical protein n=1 Tax=Undibacterium sp. TC9W TaxID=3413053 RepID=UPI003BF2E42F
MTIKIQGAPAVSEDAQKRASGTDKLIVKIDRQIRAARAERVKSEGEVVITKENKEEGTE